MTLNPCKKCGGEDIATSTLPRFGFLSCWCRKCNYESENATSKEQAAKNWNDANPLPEQAKGETVKDAKPCPFCGSTELIVYDGSTYRWHGLECADCGGRCGEIRRPEPVEGSIDMPALIAEWNTRVGATICPRCGAKNRPIDWEEALEILRSAMQRKLTEKTS